MTTNKEDALFVINEIKRFAGLNIHAIQGLSREDLIPSLPCPSGNGLLMCGRAAAERIELLAKRYLANLPLRLKQGGCYVLDMFTFERVSCAGLEVAAGAYDVRISHIHGSLSG
jgi:hypothetical protein